MSNLNPADQQFLDKIIDIIQENLSDEKFGVSELASLANMSRSNLLRKVTKLTSLSVSQLIRQERLKEAMKLLLQGGNNVTEVSYNVGFSSTSYFIKCFRDFYGYPPGEAGRRELSESEDKIVTLAGRGRRLKRIAIFLPILVLVIIITSWYFLVQGKSEVEKSIAVLPFQNDSDDPSNVYIINGLMESILNNLQNIEDLRVISRTSVEKYRDNPRLISEIAKELDVRYFVEGSGQKIGDQILLNVQLIDASNDRHLWAKQYNREVNDIFAIQEDVAKRIAAEVKAIITPEEAARIEKAPTDDIIAYDLFLKGLYLMYRRGPGDLDSAIIYFNAAIDRDQEFARAYASVAISYFSLEMFQAEKKYSDLINEYADKALLYDPYLPQSLIAKAVYYINNQESILALPYLEKALEYNPNSVLAINILSDFYTNVMPNTSKYLEYALKGLRLEFSTGDSVATSFSLLHVANAFIQSGFVKQAEHYINRSLDYYPGNLWSEYVKAYILYARDGDLQQTRDMLIETYLKDTSRWDVLQEVAKICYFMRDHYRAYDYYEKFIDLKESQNLNVYNSEDIKIGMVLYNLGKKEEADKFFEKYRIASEMDQSIYRHMNFAAYYSAKGDQERAINELRLFSRETNYNYWMVLFIEIDPVMDTIRDHPEFKEIVDLIKNKFSERHNRLRKSLEKEGLI